MELTIRILLVVYIFWTPYKYFIKGFSAKNALNPFYYKSSNAEFIEALEQIRKEKLKENQDSATAEESLNNDTKV